MGTDEPRSAGSATAFQPLRPTELLGTAFRLYRRRWPTLLAIVALAAPLAVSFPSTRALPGSGGEYQVVVHHRVVANAGSWADTAVVVLAMLVEAFVFALVAGAVTRACAGASGSPPGGCGPCSPCWS